MGWKEEEFKEKRRYVRLDIRTKVKFKLGKKKMWPSKRSTAFTKNLSVEGISFASNKHLEPGSTIKLEISVPGEARPLHLDGTVVWSNTHHKRSGKEVFDTGIKLFTIDKSDQGKFIGYVCNKMMQRLSKYLHL